MIDGLKPYPAMKDSGVDWLGEVPAHWEVRRLKTLCSRAALYGANVSAASYTETGVRFLRTTDITEEGELKIGGVRLPEELVYEYFLSDGDLLISRSGTVGRSFLYDKVTHGLCAYAGYLVRFVPAPDAFPKYLYFFTRTEAFADFLRVMAISSTIENVNGEKYANCPLPFPPSSEQDAIVRFLDHADQRIRRYIRAREKLIALLEEQKRAIIHEAVTGQIDVHTGQPFPIYKASGVEWLGRVPERWSVSRVKAEFECLNHRRRPLSGTERGAMTVREYDYYGASGKIDKVDDYLFDEELLLIAEDGANLVLRNLPLAIIASGRYWVNNHAHILKPTSGRLEYLAQLMESFDYSPWISGAAQPKLTQDRLMSIPIAVPPRHEQDVIVSHLWAATRPLCGAIDRARREIDLLREYRTRLIADVVTGKLDVRAAPAALPEEPDGRGAPEGICAGPEGKDESRTDHSRRTEFPAAQEETIA